MQLNTFKKIIASTYLLIFIFSLFTPFNKTYAGEPNESTPFIIEAEQPVINGGSSRITAKIFTPVGGETISFGIVSGVLTNLRFTPEDAKCTISANTSGLTTAPRVRSCYVSFNTDGLSGDIKIEATALTTEGSEGFYTASTSLKVCDPSEKIINNVCTAPETIKDNGKGIDTNTVYTPLVSLPGLPTEFETDSSKNACPFGNYLNIMIKIIIGMAAVLAMVMITMGGVEYMSSELISGKEAGKETVKNAIFGLLIALGAYLILNTINPQLLSACLDNLPKAEITIQPLYDRGINDPKQASGESINCTPLTSGPCSVTNLTTALGVDTATATAMSKICNMESGGRPISSGTDYCKPPGKSLPFSFGLFQVNLAANGSLAGADCVGLFDRPVSSKDAIAPKYTSGFTCSLLSGKEALYNTCKARLLDPATNLNIAKKLLTANPNKGDWVGDKAACASAFK
ncbi:MAG: hypothetical protein UR25_C0003G0155 [Candidatus Nomurabacteria bacterium GW2011_GWE1_32_28]|uniref:Transglycosylase SLT domain-containing protein n=1 Tax=Candidatus Nomurabacteria bacterium GW2011_GWF1_31_48 TaxID=1618767 RepID=A0A0G0BH56_9BACT|nr:MAG: hypothetical protein UR10_C0003G0154 [Candidatus Nomurabacteria bacterium GW2011_GWF2_30_133]KKP28794.1 MAG: hypothetical protein UR18_C0002G0206 [Candidatus Nomurabacteria bacterium GW2011_GWE2_31_40]KKP30372.1 MAG: hypothetical protein UR19_C0003G0208 [Candidatus Nomurabacteria bacterium GW2011_GWF1_31_48]KKP34899.1 MAG: hypothetical protein UR25_C0003G0155 [Candidatus Nomurabacteria bacterium GW2011_GWE1_32_28]HAS80991.1 hypothetical protein [Candidatus Nomurabacteria bacterium]